MEPIELLNPDFDVAQTRRLDNAALAEWLARQAELESGHRQRALRKASALAFLWPEEAAACVERGLSLTLFRGIGPYLEKKILDWMESPGSLESLEPPPLRRSFLTIARARSILARAPDWKASLKGDLQMHSIWSDGSGTIAEMADEAASRNYQYIAITDHSQGLKIAGGIDEPDLARQAEEIKSLNHQLENRGKSLRVLRSIELNLNPQGQGDMNPVALSQLDLVVGSFHSKLRLTEDQTARYLAGLRNPSIHILGHPRGRIYNYRLGLQADWPRVFAEAAKLDKAIEIDGYPDRQDINVELLRMARDAGVRISLSTDAHHPPQLAFIELSLAAACLAEIPPDRILNFMPLQELLQWTASLRATRSRAGSSGQHPAA